MELFRNADRFMNDNFKLHKVGFLSNRKLEKVLNHRRIHSLDDLVRIFNKSAKMVDPFCIPLECSMDHVLGGRLVAQTVVTDNEDDLDIIIKSARDKKVMLNNPNHLILTAAHPSPLSAYNGFFGCRHFSQTNNISAF